MHPIHPAPWLVIFSLVELSNGIIDNTCNTTKATTMDLPHNAASKRALALGSQDFNRCCLLAMNQAQKADGVSVENLTSGQDPCGATYSGILLALENHNLPSTIEADHRTGNHTSTPGLVNITVRWCWHNCAGWQLSRTSQLNQWVSPFLGFLIPSVVFCLAIPRRRKLYIPDGLFDVPLNEVTSNIFWTPLIALTAAVLVTLDTILWLMTVFALSGPILVSGIYEASLDQKILGFLRTKIDNGRLSLAQRAQLLYTVLVGNLDMLTVPDNEAVDNTAWSHINELLRKDRHVVIIFTQKTKTRLRTMLAAQYSFGVTVGGES